jgi:hypothetical protein
MTTVTLYEHSHKKGESLTLDSDAQNLADYPMKPSGTSWNDQVSSITVEGSNPQGELPVFYGNIEYTKGWPHDWSMELQPGEYKSLPSGFPNDQLSSVDVPSGFIVTLYEHSNLEGRKLVLDVPGDSDLTDDDMFVTWDNQTSSIEISGGNAKFFDYPNHGGFFGGVGGLIGGWSEELGPGSYDYVQDFGIPNDQISSVDFL